MEILMEISGYTGQLVITDKKIIIKRKGFGGFMSQGVMNGDKEIPIKNITGIQFKDANWLSNGHITFSNHGGLSVSDVRDANTIIFTNGQKEKFNKAKKLLDELMMKVEESLNNSSPQLSVADELKKFSDLHLSGIITEEEFIRKKRELLG